MIGVDALIFLGFVFYIMNYSEKLKHPKWQRKRLEVLQRDDFKCCLCGDDETELHIHHLKYTGEPFEAPLEHLQTICKVCHSNIEDHKEYNIEKCKGIISDDKQLRCYVYKLNSDLLLLDIWRDKQQLQGIYVSRNSPLVVTINSFFNE